MPRRAVKQAAAKAAARKPAAGRSKSNVKGPVERFGGITAAEFEKRVRAISSEAEREKLMRYFKSGEGEYGAGDVFIGVKMGELFALAKACKDMPVAELEKLLDSPVHELRAGALSIMDKQARDNKTPDSQRKVLYDLYLRRHDRINNWDLVDVSCIHVVGRYLKDRPRDVLYRLARSKNMWERRTAIVSTAYFLKSGDVADTFRIAEMLLDDNEDLIHKAVGGWIREAGKTAHRQRLLTFLDKHAAAMPRTMLRYAVEHLDVNTRKRYMNMKAASTAM